MKILIVDDERHAQETLEMLLEINFPKKFQIMGKCFSVDEAVALIKEEGNPDLVFLDVQMPHKNGFALFEEIRNIDFEVIFTTAYDKTKEAINLRPFGYLHKPISPSLLKEKMEEFILEFEERNILRKLDSLMSNMDSLGLQVFSTNDSLEFIHNDEITYCKGDGGYTTVYKEDGSELMVSKSLGVVIESLPQKQFVRVHKSCVVNAKKILRYDKQQNNLVLRNGVVLDVSTRSAKILKNLG
jgi:two-component system, LytTR family, response regulator